MYIDKRYASTHDTFDNVCGWLLIILGSREGVGLGRPVQPYNLYISRAICADAR